MLNTLYYPHSRIRILKIFGKAAPPPFKKDATCLAMHDTDTRF